MSEFRHFSGSHLWPGEDSRLALLGQISRQITQGRSPDSLTQDILTRLAHCFPDCRVAFGRRCPAATGIEITDCLGQVPAVDLTGRRLKGEQLRSLFRNSHGKLVPWLAMKTGAVESHPALAGLMGKDPIHACVLLPLHHSDQILGLLMIYVQHRLSWPREDLRFLEQVGHFLSLMLGMENAKLSHNQRLDQLQRMAGLGEVERDGKGEVIAASDPFYTLVGSEPESGGEPFIAQVHPDDRQRLRRQWKNAVTEKQAYEVEYRFQAPDQTEQVFREQGRPALDAEGRVCGISAVIQDISTEKAFRDEIHMARKIFDSAVEGVVVADSHGDIQFVNKGFTRITGYERQEVLGQNPRILKSDRHGPDFYQQMWNCIENEGQWSGEIWNRRKDGRAYPEWLTITAIQDNGGNVVRYISVFNDLSDIRQQEEKIHYQANYDVLTNLPNRTLFKDRLKLNLTRAHRVESGLSLIFLDLDDFKHVNESLGHANGDILLEMFGDRLLGCVREQDTVARYGGDEFMILIPDTDKAEVVMHIVERILKSMETAFEIDDREYFMGVSIGITTSPEDGIDMDTLLSNVDMAMYRAKESGKRRYDFFTPDLNRQVTQRFELEADLRKALARTEFVLYYQPKIDMATKRISGAEALVRWRHGQKGLVPPGDFIPVSEETGLVVPMGEWILRQACHTARAWSRHLGYPFRVAVNISPRQIRDSDLVGLVGELLDQKAIEPENLELEITETAVMADVDRAKTTFEALHDMGVHIAVDDFGTGFSSLSYLRLFPIDSLKIDKSFIDDIPQDPGSNTMVSTIISMAEHLNLNTIAEGVETQDQLDFLKSKNCNQIQGYYFSPPVPEDEFFTSLKNQSIHWEQNKQG